MPEQTHRAGMRARKLSIAALASAMMLVALAPGAFAGAAPRPIVFDYLQIGSPCVYATGPASVRVKLVWRDSNGALKFRETQVANESGDLYYCPPDLSTVLAIGDRLKATDGSVTHKLVIPNLTINVNRVTDKLKGTAPAGGTLRAECGGGPLPSFEPCLWHKRVTVNAEGKWSKSYPFDAIGGELFYVRWRSAAADIVYALAVTPFVAITLGESTFSGATKAGQTAHLKLHDPATHAVKADDDAVGDDSGGRFEGEFAAPDGASVPVSPGDELTADIAADANLIVPDVDGTASAETNIVSGRCFDTGRFTGTVFIELFRGGERSGWAFGEPDEGGNFAVDFLTDGTGFKDPADLEVGDDLLVRCQQTGGDWVQLNVVAGT